MKLSQPPTDGLLVLALTEPLTKKIIKRIADEVTQRLETHDRLRLYGEVKDWTGITPKALFEDIKFALQHFHDFEREAIVSDKAWLNAMAKEGARLFPSIEVRHFSWDDRVAALTWVEESLDSTACDGSLGDRAAI
ncbi:MAG: STAS/SEC14 domain-containing protein [Synechococcus sp.]